MPADAALNFRLALRPLFAFQCWWMKRSGQEKREQSQARSGGTFLSGHTNTGVSPAHNAARRQATEYALAVRVRDLISELDALLADDDARWHAFGLSMPADPDTPEPVEALTLTAGTPGIIVATWPRAVRATRYRPFVQIVGVDADPVARDAVHDLTVNLTGFITGQAVKVYIVAANDAGEAPAGPTAEIVAP